MTSASSAMRTSAFCKTFLKSFCAGIQRVFAQTPFGWECEGGKPSRCANLGYEVNRGQKGKTPNYPLLFNMNFILRSPFKVRFFHFGIYAALFHYIYCFFYCIFEKRKISRSLYFRSLLWRLKH